MRLILRRGLAALLLLCGTAHAELASHTSFKGEVTAYTYDALGREVTRTFADGQQVRTTYTPTGQVASVTDARGTTTYAYDARDRVIRIDYPDGQWVAYAWDGNGNRTALSTPTGTTTYAYDDGNRLVQVTDPAGQVTTYAWDEAGNPTGQTLPNGVSTFRAYDDNGQLAEVRHEKDGTLLAKFSYERDEDGRRTGATEVQLDPASGALHSRTLAWTYDELGQLASETLTESGHTTTTAWTHDEVGNRLSEARFREGVLLATDRYSYDANDRLTRAWTENGAGGTVSETVYSYDANGATTEVVRTGGFSRTYAYDAAQRLVGVSDSTGQRITYGYDAEGNRVTQVVQQSPDLAQNGSWRYLLDPLAPFTEVVATLTDAGQAETDYRFGAGRIAERTAGQLLYYCEDGHHSVRLVTDAQGNIVAHLNYAAFGQAAGSVTDDASGNPAVSPAFRYTGQQWDGALGEYYLRARTYDPGVGRFTQRDSWQGNSLRPVTLNAYVYANADPITNMDPSGFEAYTPSFGRAAENYVCERYRLAFGEPGDNFDNLWECGQGQPTGMGTWLKPDIFDFVRKRFAEVKPLSPTGVAAGQFQIGIYNQAFGRGSRYDMEAEANWMPSPATIQGRNLHFLNVQGIIFYTDDSELKSRILSEGVAYGSLQSFVRRHIKVTSAMGVAAVLAAYVRVATIAARMQTIMQPPTLMLSRF